MSPILTLLAVSLPTLFGHPASCGGLVVRGLLGARRPLVAAGVDRRDHVVVARARNEPRIPVERVADEIRCSPACTALPSVCEWYTWYRYASRESGLRHVAWISVGP